MATDTVFPIHEFSDIDVAFPASVTKYMPPYADIPKEYKHGDTKWNKLFNSWFFVGLKSLDLTAKEGIDKNKALRHIRCVMGSWEPQHEHKEAAVAYLLDQWFSDAKWIANDRK